MPSTYTDNGGIEKIATGEQSGTWGDTTNTNLDILDRITNGVGTITLSGTTHTLDTTNGTLSDGMYKVLVLGGSPSGTNTITVTPSNAQKLYFVYNNSGQDVIFSQGGGANVTVANGDSKVLYLDGGEASAAVFDLTANFAMSSVNITGGSVTGITDLDLADGGTGASSASAARTNLGLAIGSDVQAFDALLQDISALAATLGHAIVGDGTNLISTASSTDAMIMPAGTTGQRPTAVNGMIRYNSSEAKFEGYANGAWGTIGGGGFDTQETTTTSVSQVAVGTYDAATVLGLKVLIQVTDTVATERYITELLVTHDGVTAVATEYGQVATDTALSTFDVDINTGNIRILATPASTNSTTFLVRGAEMSAVV